jgi:hypothetical protein
MNACSCIFQLAPITISTDWHQLCGSCGAGNTRVFFFLSDRRRVDMCSNVSSPLITTCCQKLSLQMKHDAFNLTPKTDDKFCNGRGRHSHNARKLSCRNHKWKQCSSLFDIKGIVHFEFIPQGQKVVKRKVENLVQRLDALRWQCSSSQGAVNPSYSRDLISNVLCINVLQDY